MDHLGRDIQVELRVAGKRIQRLPDPAGGSFDTAGDFDRLVFHGNPAPELSGRLDPHGETRFGAGQMLIRQATDCGDTAEAQRTLQRSFSSSACGPSTEPLNAVSSTELPAGSDPLAGGSRR